jgi:hypothetical protein
MLFRKVIVSHLGEVLEDTRTVGDRIRYRIIFQPVRTGIECQISDVLDEGLTDVTVFGRGRYNPKTHTATWMVVTERPGQVVRLELEATIHSDRVIRNQAICQCPKSEAVKTNVVQTVPLKPPKTGWIPLMKDVKPGEPVRAYMKDETTMGVTVRFDFPGLLVYEEKVDGVAYQRLSIPGRATLTDVGKPELPIAGEMVEVPFKVKLTPEVVDREAVVLEGYNVYPAQLPLIDVEQKPRPFELDRRTYLSKADYPAVLATAHDDDIGVIRGHRVASLKVNPVQYNPLTRRVTVYSKIEVRLNYDRPAQIGGVEPRLVSQAFEEMLQASVLNYKAPERFAQADAGASQDDEPSGCHYLIITEDSFYSPDDPDNPIVQLADWKRRKGLLTRIKKVSTIQGGNTDTAIQDYIQNAYDTWDPAPTYVLLVGDSDLVAPFPGEPHPLQGDPDTPQPPVQTDLYYATVDGSDYYPDIHIGRLPADSQAQLEDIVDKIIAYEKDPPAQADFYDHVSLVALFADEDDHGNFDGREDRPWIGNMETIRNFLIGEGYDVERIYATDSGFPADPAAEDPEQYQDGTNLPADLRSPTFGWDGDTAQIEAALNAGRFLLTYRGHGWWGGLAQPAFNLWDFGGLTQNGLTPVVCAFTCEAGWFDNETDDDALAGHAAGTECFGEEFLRTPQAGAVAFLGMTRISWTPHNDFVIFGLHRAIWPDFVPNPAWSGTYPAIPNAAPVRLLRMGQILNFAKLYMAKAYAAGDLARQIEFEMGHLLGDPDMPIWTEEPGDLDVVHPAGIGETGLQEFVVRVADADSHDAVLNATVVLTRGNSIVQMQQTNSFGMARFSFPYGGGATLDITVTARSFRPYLGQIAVETGGAVLGIDPLDGPVGQTIAVTGDDFMPGEDVNLLFDGRDVGTATANASGEFGYGSPPVEIEVPAGQALGLVNVEAYGATSGRYAVRVFQVRGANPVDLYTYDQHDSSTWWLHPGDNPTWNSPDIQLYDDSGNEVASNNLVLGERYTVRVNVRNSAAFDAERAKVIFRWRDYGAGGPWDVFEDTTVDVPADPPGLEEARAEFSPGATGHLCIKATIEHIEDTNTSNNEGQENLHVGFSSSPAEVCFAVWNLTKHAAPVYVEVRQLIPPWMQEEERLWPAWVRHPDPQVLQPGKGAQVCVIVDPDKADIQAGTTAEFAVTAFIRGEMIGGVNLQITKK